MSEADVLDLSQYPDDAMLTKALVCRIFGMHPVALTRAIRQLRFPPGVLICGRKYWRAGTLREWLRSRAERAVAEQHAVTMRLHRA